MSLLRMHGVYSQSATTLRGECGWWSDMDEAKSRQSTTSVGTRRRGRPDKITFTNSAQRNSSIRPCEKTSKLLLLSSLYNLLSPQSFRRDSLVNDMRGFWGLIHTGIGRAVSQAPTGVLFRCEAALIWMDRQMHSPRLINPPLHVHGWAAHQPMPFPVITSHAHFRVLNFPIALLLPFLPTFYPCISSAARIPLPATKIGKLYLVLPRSLKSRSLGIIKGPATPPVVSLHPSPDHPEHPDSIVTELRSRFTTSKIQNLIFIQTAAASVAGPPAPRLPSSSLPSRLSVGAIGSPLLQVGGSEISGLGLDGGRRQQEDGTRKSQIFFKGEKRYPKSDSESHVDRDIEGKKPGRRGRAAGIIYANKQFSKRTILGESKTCWEFAGFLEAPIEPQGGERQR
ncbi:hypothetical protein C8R43DRAFT_959244 [Mycena crocata]|nr:hypothetical protein C8R43DRAFT_959244 [Mycena crocata]